MLRPSLPLYNQSTLNDDDFITAFVARHDSLEILLRRLRTIEPDQDHHYVLIGPRGMGKTSLLRRIAIAINREPDLAAHYVPLGFREEQYNVLSLAGFWHNCVESLAEWADATGRRDLADRLDAGLAAHTWVDSETSAEKFNAELASLQRRAVLLVDNVDLILDALPDDENWKLRRHLQARQGPIMIGAATQSLRQSADQEAAFYEFFEPVYLEPLDVLQTENCMRALARGRGSEGNQVIDVLDKQPERLRTLHTLTGGNPRVLTLIYHLLEAGQSEAAMADLEILLDQVTPYYKARVEEYQTPQQRAVIDAIALHWDPITTGDLARVTNIVTTTLSPLLSRLRKDGLIENVETSGSYAGHQLVERFFNIWYLMRHGTRRTKQKMRWLVAFLTCFYSLHELTDLARRADDKGLRKAWRIDYAMAFDEALEHLRASPVVSDQIRSAALEAVVPRDLEDAAPEGEKEAEKAWLAEAGELLQQALQFFKAADYSRSMAAVDEVLVRLDDMQAFEARSLLVAALLAKAISLCEMGDNAAAIAVCNDIVARFGDSRDPVLREGVAYALLRKAVAFDKMGDGATAVAIYNDVLARYGDAQESALREAAAGALISKAGLLRQRGDGTAAVAIYDDVLERLGDAEEPGLRAGVAGALVNKAFTLSQMGNHAAAVANYDEVLARFGDAQEFALQEQVGTALFDKAVTLGQMGDWAGQVAVNNDFLARFGDSRGSALREQVAMALVTKAVSLLDALDNATAIATFEQLFELPVHDLPRLAHVLAVARVTFANMLLDSQEDFSRAESLYRDAAPVEPLSANANLAWLLLLSDRVSEAVALRNTLGDLPANDLALLDAAIHLSEDNFGSATDDLARALVGEPDTGPIDFTDDLNRLLRLAEKSGYGERLIEWFEKTGFAERLAPLYAAFKAYVRNENLLLDVNPEVRRPALVIYDRLDAPRRHRSNGTSKKSRTKSGRGPRRKPARPST